MNAHQLQTHTQPKIAGGFTQFPNWVLEQGLLTPYEIAVFLGISRHMPNAFPSISRLAHYARMSVRQVSRCLARLVELGLVEKDLIPGRSSNYSFGTRVFSEGARRGLRAVRGVMPGRQRRPDSQSGVPMPGRHTNNTPLNNTESNNTRIRPVSLVSKAGRPQEESWEEPSSDEALSAIAKIKALMGGPGLFKAMPQGIGAT